MTVVAPSADCLRDGDPAGDSGVGRAGDAPTDEELWGLAPDPDTDQPGGAALAGIPADLTLAWLDAQAAAERGAARWFEPGGLSRPGGRAGKAFAAGGPADGLEPGVVLAGLTARAWEASGRVSDDELVGITRAFGRLAAWAAAGQLAGVAELAARREEQVAAGADPHLAEHVADEVAAALMLTRRTCTFPGCRRPAARCDLDHTVPHDQGGRTCVCNLAPLCRRHHQAKQAQGWHLDQPEPGHLSWTLPHGRAYRAGPDPYPEGGP